MLQTMLNLICFCAMRNVVLWHFLFFLLQQHLPSFILACYLNVLKLNFDSLLLCHSKTSFMLQTLLKEMYFCTMRNVIFICYTNFYPFLSRAETYFWLKLQCHSTTILFFFKIYRQILFIAILNNAMPILQESAKSPSSSIRLRLTLFWLSNRLKQKRFLEIWKVKL